MNVLFTVLIIIVSILLILIVLVQNSKGGGLASNFASSNQFMGVRKTADFLEKATWTLAVALLLFCLVSSATFSNKGAVQKSAIESQKMNTIDPTTVPFQNNDQKPAAPAGPSQAPASNKSGNQEKK